MFLRAPWETPEQYRSVFGHHRGAFGQTRYSRYSSEPPSIRSHGELPVFPWLTPVDSDTLCYGLEGARTRNGGLKNRRWKGENQIAGLNRFMGQWSRQTTGEGDTRPRRSEADCDGDWNIWEGYSDVPYRRMPLTASEWSQSVLTADIWESGQWESNGEEYDYDHAVTFGGFYRDGLFTETFLKVAWVGLVSRGRGLEWQSFQTAIVSRPTSFLELQTVNQRKLHKHITVEFNLSVR